MKRFEGRTALITGAGHGIGRATAERLGLEGAAVAAVDLNGEALAETVEALRARAIASEAWTADVSDEQEVERVVGEVRARFGRIDVLHSNAGVLLPGSAVDATLADWDRSFAVNVRASFLLARAVLPAMRAQGGGAIVLTASTAGILGEAALAAYCASKGALVNFARQLAVDYSRDGIRTNCVCPGWIETGFNDPVLDGVGQEELARLIDSTVPLGRQGTPEEVAAAVAFLASEDASLVTGHALVVDGGLAAV